MRQKKQTERAKAVDSRRIGTFSINARYAPDVLCPMTALDPAMYKSFMNYDEIRLRTLDGKTCRAVFETVWVNVRNEYDEELDDFCKRKFNRLFTALRSMWIARLRQMSDVWYWIKLELVA